MARDRDYLTVIGGASAPSKMPCKSWSIPATRCKLGSMLAEIEGTTCSSCYARKGCYVFPSTVEAMERRVAHLDNWLADPTAMDAAVEAFASWHRRRYERTARRLARDGTVGSDDGRYFRWHDSGDLQSPEHLLMIVRIARAVPEVAFWLPTREIGIVARWIASGGRVPGNLTIRLSVPRRNDAGAPALHKLAETCGITLSGVHDGDTPPEGFEACGAYQRDGECGPCRACWEDVNISYPRH